MCQFKKTVGSYASLSVYQELTKILLAKIHISESIAMLVRCQDFFLGFFFPPTDYRFSQLYAGRNKETTWNGLKCFNWIDHFGRGGDPIS